MKSCRERPTGRRVIVALILVAGLVGCDGTRSGYDDPNPGLPPMRPDEIKALTCEFVSRHVADLGDDAGRPRAGDKMSLTFIDLTAPDGHAAVVGNAGQAPVSARRGEGQFVFIEHTPAGSVNTTSVFWSTASRRMAAAHSRHVLVAPGAAVVSQYTGYCDPKV